MKIMALWYAVIVSIVAFSAGPAISQPIVPAERAINFLPKKSLNKRKLGVNAFVNDSRFGSVAAQLREVKNSLGLKHIRVLFNWNNQVQPTRGASPFFGFYDEIAASIPSGVNALVILNGLPSWMSDSSNWIDGNPRLTFVKLWVEPVVKRYANNKRIKAFQIWNEQNMEENGDNGILKIDDSPENYVELLALAHNVVKNEAPRKKVVLSATTAINQNYPETLNYNEAMRAAGADEFADFSAIHIYGMHLENFFLRRDLPDFLKSSRKPIWVTESGEKGTNKQKEYAQRMWPFLFSEFSKIKRLYIYQFTEDTPASQTYGLRNLTAGAYLSDLYLYLKSLKKRNRKR